MRFSIFSLILMCCPLGLVWAGAPILEPNLCVKDSRACQKLAIEVAKLDYYDFISREQDLREHDSFLCPEDNPQCCPPHLMPICAQVEKDLVVEARRVFQSMVSSRFGDCPWSSEICDSLGPFYCGPDGGWTPWGGCSPGIVYEPPIPPDPPLPCPCGTVPNSKGLCISKVCTMFGTRVPCRTLCDAPDKLTAKSSAQRPESNLGRHLADTKVQLEAAKKVREDLKSALNVLEKKIRELSKYKSGK